ncbi:MAG: hypothetical protein VYB35_06845, partial [Verrucomicrobiota bacterium]|nr:hypothetical protein [Verrucomicrobiota bacterium]
MNKVQNMALILGIMVATLPTALGGLMSGDAVLGAGFYFSSFGDLLILLGSSLLFLNFLGAIVMSIKCCDCLASLCGKRNREEVEA